MQCPFCRQSSYVGVRDDGTVSTGAPVDEVTVLAVLGADERPNLAAPWVCRHEQWITIDGHRGVPLAATVPSGPLATAGVDER